MHAAASFKVFGLVSVVLSWLAVGYILKTAPQRDIAKSISHHVAARKGGHYFYAVIITVALGLLYLFGAKWFIPHFHLGWAFTWVFVAAIIAELITTWVPLTTGLQYTIHQGFSYGAALLINVLLAILVFSPRVTGLAKDVTIVCLGLMLVVWALFLFVPQSYKHYLYYQTAYLVAFHASLIAIAYVA